MKKRIVLILVIVSVVTTGVFASSVRSNKGNGSQVEREFRSMSSYEKIDEVPPYKNRATNEMFSSADCTGEFRHSDNRRDVNNKHSREDMRSNPRQGNRVQTDRNNEMRRANPNFLLED